MIRLRRQKADASLHRTAQQLPPLREQRVAAARFNQPRIALDRHRRVALRAQHARHRVEHMRLRRARIAAIAQHPQRLLLHVGQVDLGLARAVAHQRTAAADLALGRRLCRATGQRREQARAGERARPSGSPKAADSG
ncbi:hypothetical protein WI87_09780 [Burkholderia ubonensis]|nr:hypothetical protein WI87_09780 [Burkholderia ubonensis]